MASKLTIGLPAFFVALQMSCSAALSATGAAERIPMINSYHGTSVTDDYQWLEKADSPKTRDWSRSQNERSRAYFDSLPYRDGIAQQLTQIRGEESARVYALRERKGRIFALRFKPPAQQPVLIRLASL